MVKSAVEKIQHDVNNPLCIVTMSLSRLENLIAIQPHPELVKSFEEINISVDRIMEILTGLEDIKRMLEGAS
jgi:signal transduction histidine kinase